MKHLGTIPNSITFVCILLTCNHAGIIDEGCKWFNYTCIVDLIGNVGYDVDIVSRNAMVVVYA